MQAEVVDSGRQLPSIPTVSQRMPTVYAIRRKNKRLRRILRVLSNDKNESRSSRRLQSKDTESSAKGMLGFTIARVRSN